MTGEKKYYRIFNPATGEDFFDAYYAVSEDGWTLRFVEKKEDGSLGFANDLIEVGGAFLPEASMYPITWIDKDGYKLTEITPEEFDKKWDEPLSRQERISFALY